MKKLLLIVFLITFCLSSLYAAKWRVNNTEGIDADFTTIQGANNSDEVNAGDTIYIEGSLRSYDNNSRTEIRITKSLFLIGPGYFLAENDSTQVNKQAAEFYWLSFREGSSGSKVMGLSVSFLYIHTDNITVRRNYIHRVRIYEGNNQNISENYITEQIQNPNSNITDGFITNNIVNFIALNINSEFQIINNTVFYTSGNVINVYNSEIRNNILKGPMDLSSSRNNKAITNNIFSQDGPDENGNIFNVDMNTVFVNEGSTDGKFKLSQNSPAKDVGLGGVDCGAFGGNNPYKLSGIPPGPSIYEARIPATVPKGSKLQVTIKVKSHN